MNILYLSQSYVPSRRADSVQVMKMCAAFARQGHQVELVTKACPGREEPAVDDDHAFYGVPPSFRILKLPRPELKGGGLVFAWRVARLLSRRQERCDLVFCRDPFGAWLAARRGGAVAFEAHGPPRGRLARRLHRDLASSRSLRRMVFISEALRGRFRELGLLPPEDQTLVAHDAADPLPEPASADPESAGRPRIGYVGHLYPGRGIELIAALAERLDGCDFHLVGGHDAEVAAWRQRTRTANVSFHGFVAPGRLARLYRDFDLLLMPYQRRVGVQSGRSDTADWMSPMKMFEYMAAGKPIVSSDLPVLREVLRDGHNALLAPPDDPAAWEAALRRLLDDRPLARRLAGAARRDFLERHTFDARAAAVLHGL